MVKSALGKEREDGTEKQRGDGEELVPVRLYDLNDDLRIHFDSFTYSPT